MGSPGRNRLRRRQKLAQRPSPLKSADSSPNSSPPPFPSIWGASFEREFASLVPCNFVKQQFVVWPHTYVQLVRQSRYSQAQNIALLSTLPHSRLQAIVAFIQQHQQSAEDDLAQLLTCRCSWECLEASDDGFEGPQCGCYCHQCQVDSEDYWLIVNTFDSFCFSICDLAQAIVDQE